MLKFRLLKKVFIITFFTGAFLYAKTITPSSKEERLEYLQNAASWYKQKPEKRSLLKGQKQKKKWKKFSFDETVECSFQEPDPNDKPGGATPKFWCVDDQGHSFKVKYQQGQDFGYHGVHGEILATRLFWALGFPADAIYPVKIKCKNCPQRPWEYIKAFYNNKTSELKKPRVQVLEIDNAVIEFKFPYDKIEMTKSQGWSWSELKTLSKENEELATQREALALLAAFVQHADNKAEQQRLVCMDEDRKKEQPCLKPMLMIQDLGFSFGQGDLNNDKVKSTASLEGFKDAPIWSNKEQCITHVNYYRTGEPIEIKVSEKARRFLVDKLEKLSDNDLINLFVAARLELRKDEKYNSLSEEDIEQNAVILDWVNTFKQRVQKLSHHRCPN
jgi:hypothetical protein